MGYFPTPLTSRCGTGFKTQLQKTKRRIQTNTEITIHPKLQHCGLTTGNLDGMLEWYGKVLGMTVNKRVAAPAGTPFKTVAFCQQR